jgi:Ser/Thr protein kinase RdoA (MazF antagonist)
MNEDSDQREQEAVALRCLRDHYGIEGSLSRLGGENINYLVRANEGKRYVLKIVDEHMPSDVVAMEYAAVEHAISKGFRLKLPIIIKNKNNKLESGINIRINGSDRAILFNYIEGDILGSLADISQILAKDIGNNLALFDLSMAGFEHPAAHRSHRWDLTKVDQHEDKIELIKDPDRRELLAWAFHHWSTGAKPNLTALPHQFIHGDANGENILVEGESVTGLLDFGDSCFNPAICELAICLPYMMMGQVNPLEIGAGVAAAYHACRPLSEAEFSVLLPLVCGRLAVTVSMAAERKRIDSSHPSWYISEDGAWDLLQLLSASAEFL